MGKDEIRKRLSALREAMRDNGIDYYLIPSSDYHNSEYAADFFHARAYFSGFTGSAGTLLVGRESAGLWTDGRYFVQATAQLKDTTITMYKMQTPGQPTLLEYLKENMREGEVLGFDGQTLPAETGVEYAQALKEKKIVFKYGLDLADAIWKERPALPHTKAWLFDEAYSGLSCAEKMKALREKMQAEDCGVFFLSKLDDICWLLNIRGGDVACNPVVLTHLLLTMDHAYLFIQKEALDEETQTYFKANGITTMDYHNTANYLGGYHPTANVLFDRANVSYRMFMVLRDITVKSGHTLVNRPNPTTMMKAVKNETELAHTRETYLADSALLTKFLYMVKHRLLPQPMTEVSVAKALDEMRASCEDYIDLSFDTISGYAENGAIVHYHAEEETCKEIGEDGMLLVDSGATYKGGTTDVTRTIVMGKITDEMKLHYTRTCVAMLRLANAVFLYGCSGRNVDTFARGPLWEIGVDYNHGTGHGVGYVLNVHEGPHNIRWRYAPGMREVALESGMLISDEPGVYIEGSHGIRIENILEIREHTENVHGKFLGFAHLTFAPIDPDGIDPQYMEPADIKALNEYHAQVYEKIAPRIEEPEIRDWLKQVTKPI